MRVLITGGLGFIGGRLADFLAQAGHQIIIGTRNLVRPPDWLPNAEVMQIKWNESRQLEKCCEGVDIIIHAAGMNAQECTENPLAALEFNGVATANLVSAAIRFKVKKFVYLSTAHVYSSPLCGVISEDTFPRNKHPYATSHLAGEHSVLKASQNGLIQGIILRVSNAYGVPMHKSVNCWMLLVNDLCKQVVQTRKLVLRTNGQQKRDFISMIDVCRIIKLISVEQKDLINLGVLNVGSGNSKTVYTMAELIQKRCRDILGFEPELQTAPSKANDDNSELDFRTNKLLALGFRTNESDSIIEIDNLLRFCQTSFI